MTRTFAFPVGYIASFGRGKPFLATFPAEVKSGVLSVVLQIETLESKETLEILESRLRSSTSFGANDGIADGDTFGVGAAILIETPLFQTNFLPDFIHV